MDKFLAAVIQQNLPKNSKFVSNVQKGDAPVLHKKTYMTRLNMTDYLIRFLFRSIITYLPIP